MNDQDLIVAICAVSKGDLPLDIKWYFNSDVFQSGLNGVMLTNTKRTSQLTIESVSHHNQGNYTCVVKNQAGTTNHTAELFVNGISDETFYQQFPFIIPSSSSVDLNVFELFFAKSFPFTVPPQIMPFEFGEEPVNAQEMVLVTCTVTKGDLPLKIQWYFNGKFIKSGQIGVNLANTKRTSQLSIESVTHQNQGNYSCVVNNDAGNTNHTAQLYVNGIHHNRFNISRKINIGFVYLVVIPSMSFLETLAGHKCRIKIYSQFAFILDATFQWPL